MLAHIIGIAGFTAVPTESLKAPHQHWEEREIIWEIIAMLEALSKLT